MSLPIARGKRLVHLAQMMVVSNKNEQDKCYDSETSDNTASSDDSLRDANYVPSSPESPELDEAHEQEPGTEAAVVATQTICSGRPRKGRKRIHGNQTRAMKKELRNSNKQYINNKGVTIKPKQFENYLCKCTNKCHELVSVEERQKLFNKYWELGSYNAQTAFLGTLVSEGEVKRTYSKKECKRKHTRIYKINKVKVCRNQFINTLKISTKRIHTALTKLKSDSIVDKRGEHGGYNAISDDKLKKIIEHIQKIPKYKSHYRREQLGDAAYLESHMTILKMYSLYKQETEDPVGYEKYKQVLYSHFNIKRKPLKKDTCNLCDKFSEMVKSGENEEKQNEIRQQHNKHLDDQATARNRMNNDLHASKVNDTLEVLTYDMEKTLPLPRIPTNIIYYKRQIWLYNTGVHSGKYNRGFCYTWVEGTAGRGAQEVGSCLIKHIKKHVSERVTDLILWSDSCGGQNRNIKIVLLLKAALELHPSLQSISFRYLVPGHSFLKNDSDFSDIEKALKLQQRLYTSDDYLNIMRSCRARNPLIVDPMCKEEFFSSATCEKKITNRKTDISGAKINWLHLREIKLLKNKPFSIFVTTSHKEPVEYSEIDFTRIKGRGRRSETTSNDIFSSCLEILWPEGKPISENKLNDIQSIMHLIPEDAKQFYEQLRGDDTVEDYLDGFDGKLDFEYEDN